MTATAAAVFVCRDCGGVLTDDLDCSVPGCAWFGVAAPAVLADRPPAPVIQLPTAAAAPAPTEAPSGMYPPAEHPYVKGGVVVPAMSAPRTDPGRGRRWVLADNIAQVYETATCIGIWLKAGGRMQVLWQGKDPQARVEAVEAFVSSWAAWQNRPRR